MGKKPKDKTGWKSDQRIKHSTNVDDRVKRLEKTVDSFEVEEEINKENEQIVNNFWREHNRLRKMQKKGDKKRK